MLNQESVQNGVDIVIFGEFFNVYYSKENTLKDAEILDENSLTRKFLSSCAKKNKIYIIGGSIPEKTEDEKYYNTCMIFDREGNLLTKHRKVHLFDIDIKGKITFKESDFLTKGEQITTFDTEFCKIGVGICYDIRFPELSMLMAKSGAKLLVFPAQFNQTTGPLHWEILLKSRALDNQVYVAGVSMARNIEDPTSYQCWGHSTFVDPMGQVLTSCEQEEKILYGEIDLDKLNEVRNSLPYQFQKRTDLYKLEAL